MITDDMATAARVQTLVHPQDAQPKAIQSMHLSLSPASMVYSKHTSCSSLTRASEAPPGKNGLCRMVASSDSTLSASWLPSSDEDRHFVTAAKCCGDMRLTKPVTANGRINSWAPMASGCTKDSTACNRNLRCRAACLPPKSSKLYYQAIHCHAYYAHHEVCITAGNHTTGCFCCDLRSLS